LLTNCIYQRLQAAQPIDDRRCRERSVRRTADGGALARKQSTVIWTLLIRLAHCFQRKPGVSR
jgi:hypothetical protein